MYNLSVLTVKCAFIYHTIIIQIIHNTIWSILPAFPHMTLGKTGLTFFLFGIPLENSFILSLSF
jgi:hypothetical protein